MIIRKLRLFLEGIEDFFDRWGQSIVGDLENGGQASDDHVDRLFEVS